MQSALDRKRGRILLRKIERQTLMHELGHVYLDMRWKVLPYPVSEPFVVAMADLRSCGNKITKTHHLLTDWERRTTMPRCDLLELLKNILNAPDQERNRLPL